MAPKNSSINPAARIQYSFSNGLDPDTTFVEADPETFRAVVQRLTGAPTGTGSTTPAPCSFNLHQRRPTARKLEMIKLHNHTSTAASALHSRNHAASPVSPLEYAAATEEEEEEKAIAAKGFYFHHSTPARSDPPELLHLFPLTKS